MYIKKPYFSIMLKRTCILLTILLLFNFMEAEAQRVALVLSGGGSRGAAHIGVIKALEENNIPIDYIAGTSIGAVIGGMYAAGFTVEEMDSLLQTDDFQLWATGQKSEAQHFYYNDQFSDPSWIRLRFGLSNGKLHYKLPTNIISPLSLDYKMVEFFAGPSAAANYDFDSLCIPFRCVSSDIDSNKAYTLSHGDLGKSIRTSMTFPFVFKPISIDGKILFDGGMYNNFPADVALETWAPDVIIGSQVAGNYDKPDLNDILSQLQNLLMNNTDYSVRIKNGVLIKPDVKRVQLTDFSMTEAFIDSGYRATLNLMPTIDSLVKRRTDKPTCDKNRNQFLAKIPELLVDSLEITGVNKSLAHRIEKNILKKAPNQTLDEVKKMYYRISSNGNINYILPEMRFDTTTNHFIMKMEIETKPRFEFRVGGNISSNFVNEGFLAVSYNYLGALSNTTSIEAYVGQFYSALDLKNSTYFQGRTTFILNSNLHTSRKNYIKNNAFFYDSESPNFLELTDNYFNINLQTPIKNRAILEAGYFYAENKSKYYQTNRFSKLDTTDQTNFNFSRIYLKFDRNNLNRKQYANSGHQLLVKVNGYFGKEHYTPGSTAWPGALPINLYHSWGEASLKLQNYFTIHDRFAIGLNVEATVSNQPFFNNYTSSLLMAPSYSPTPTSTTYYLPQFRAYNFAAGGGQLVFSVIKNLDLRAEAYYFQPYKAIHIEEGYKPVLGDLFSDPAFMANASVVWSTFMGPICIGLNYFQDEEDPFMVVFNMGFLLFPPSSR